MKSVGIVMVVGFILLYFVNAAFKVDIWHQEILIHSAIRFFTGFIAIGIWFFLKHKIRFMNVLYIILAVAFADDIWDYFRNINSFQFEAELHGAYMLLWGALAGYVFARHLKNKRDKRWEL
jgi:di/tricarboxylate transporter